MSDLGLKLPCSYVQFIHLALQLIAGFWALVIDGYPCQENNVRLITYIAYGLLVFNIILFFLHHFRYVTSDILSYFAFLLNLCFLAALFYFTITGYNNYNTCAQSKALYQFFFIQLVITVILVFLIIIGNVFAGDRYAQWPGNLAWPILFLKVRFSDSLFVFALIIGIIYAVISVMGFIVNVIHGKIFEQKSKSFLAAQFGLALVLMIACEGLALYVLIALGKDGDYLWSYCRAIFVLFAAVNIIDIIFSFYGYQKMSIL